MPENLEVDEKVTTFAHVNETSRDGAEVARWAHNPKVVGSNPAPATKRGSPFGGPLLLYTRHRHARRLIRSGEPPARRLLGHVESRHALLRSRIGYDRLDAPCAIPRRFPADMPRWGSPSAHTQTGRSQLQKQLSALCLGLSWRCLISPLLPRREQ